MAAAVSSSNMLLRPPRCMRYILGLSLLSFSLLLFYYAFVLPKDQDIQPFLHHLPLHHDEHPPPPPPPPDLPFWPLDGQQGAHVNSEIWSDRAEAVKDAFRHAYSGYEAYAAPYDELRPLTKKPWTDRFNGWGVSIFDSLDTMLIMGLHDEYQRGMQVVKATNFSLEDNHFAPFFETVIRYLGGLLSAYTLSKDPILLQRAEELAVALDPAFNTPSGLPAYGVNTVSGAITTRMTGILAEIGSLQLEYTYLAKLTGKKHWYDRAKHIEDVFVKTVVNETGGMLPTQWSLETGKPWHYTLSIGAEADSGHEYLLKQYLLTAKTDKAYLEMYIRATTQILTKLTYISPNRRLVYVTDAATFTIKRPAGGPSHKFEHLSCFFPGLLALGAYTLPLDNLESLGINLKELGQDYGFSKDGYEILSSYNLKDVHMWAAEALTQTCYLLYADMPTGLAADEVQMTTPVPQSNAVLWINALESWKKSGSRGPPPGTGRKNRVTNTDFYRSKIERDYKVKKSDYLLRPETIESIFIMWRVTSNDMWREMGWQIFEAIERTARTNVAYATIRSVADFPPELDNEMPSFFLAETLKYLYLLMDNDGKFDLNEWVFNTEAHPFRIAGWTDEEKKMGV